MMEKVFGYGHYMLWQNERESNVQQRGCLGIYFGCVAAGALSSYQGVHDDRGGCVDVV